ncbi:ubiquinol-cytochrome-c reductase complex assembly factor 3 [Brachionichthys hirsutus]|uniref:ubiquinol-cytochrome-c reductase complex assembly factor 3 n=1 Tax=Brachionichthys hirsutus TaxID=412623 RepID=UPI0036044418
MGGLWTPVNLSAVLGVLVLGYGLWAGIVPEEDRSMKHLPESNPERTDESRKRSALFTRALKDAAETKANLAREHGRRAGTKAAGTSRGDGVSVR